MDHGAWRARHRHRSDPFTHKATITLTDKVKDEQMMGMGDRGIMLSGGTLNLHGDRKNSWTKLSSDRNQGQHFD